MHLLSFPSKQYTVVHKFVTLTAVLCDMSCGLAGLEALLWPSFLFSFISDLGNATSESLLSQLVPVGVSSKWLIVIRLRDFRLYAIVN